MGDSGDYWHGVREQRRAYRSTLVECLCGRKVDPKRPCPDCDRIDDPEAWAERERALIKALEESSDAER